MEFNCKVMTEKKEENHYVYMVECADGSYYTGYTNNLEKRIKVHNSGKGAKYTKARLPVRLIYWECFEKKQEAMRREWKIKQMPRRKKEELKKSGELQY